MGGTSSKSDSYRESPSSSWNQNDYFQSSSYPQSNQNYAPPPPAAYPYPAYLQEDPNDAPQVAYPYPAPNQRPSNPPPPSQVHSSHANKPQRKFDRKYSRIADNYDSLEEKGDYTQVEKEGENLLGAPRFKKLENGRLKCVETGHELPDHAKDSYAQTKHCRLGLIESFLKRNKPPLNMFQQDPASSSKLTCKLTGLTVNKSEEHIWKHLNGKRFMNMLDKKEAEKEAPNGTSEGPSEEKSDVKENEDGSEKKKKKKEKKKKKNKKNNKQMEEDEENANGLEEVKNPSDEGNISEEVDFWIPPPPGERWDCDDGGQQYGSDSGPETDDASGEDGADEGNESDVEELSKKEKRTSVESDIDNCMPRNKKNKTKSTSQE